MVGCRSEMFAGMPEVDNLGFGRQGLQEGPIVGGAVGDSDDPDVGAQLPDMCDFACELRLQCDLAALRHAAEIEGLQTLAPGVVEGNRAAGGLAPGGLGAAVLAGPQRHHDAVERHRGADRLVRYALGVTDAVQRLGAEGLPALVHGPCQALQGAHRRRHAADLRKERRRFPRRAVTHHQLTELGRRPRQVIVDEAQALVDRRRRCPARAAAVTRSPVGQRTERGLVFAVTATRNQLCPSRSIRDAPSSRFSMTAPRSSQASAFMVSRTRNSASSNASGHGSGRNCS